MEITYTWKVTGLKTANDGDTENFVFQTYWEKIGTDEQGNQGKFVGATPFKKNPNQTDFVPFDQLTEEVVLGWIQAEVVGGYADHVNARIREQLEAKRVVVNKPEFPWGGTNTVADPVVLNNQAP